MGKRGPRPAGNLSVIEPSAPQRPAPPAGMEPRPRNLFRKIVAAYPAEHFKAGDLPMLRAYCEAEAMHYGATKAIREQGAIITNSRSGAMKANPWVAIQTQTAHTMAQLAQKLGLCKSARNTAKEKDDAKPKSKRSGLMFGGGN